MKPGIAVLPLEVWADIFLSPWFTRHELAQILDGMVNRNFANKLDKLLHGCGQQTLHNLWISCKTKKDTLKYQLIRKFHASLVVSRYSQFYGGKYCEFPQSEMPENIKTFKQLKIGYLNDQVLDFLAKIKPLFTNVVIYMGLVESDKKLCILLGHLLPMLGGIRQFNCGNYYVELLERHFPGILALAKELDLFYTEPSSIPTYLSWLSAPQDFDVHGPRFLKIKAKSNVINAMIYAVCKDFLVATAPSTFVILIDNGSITQREQPDHRAEEFNLDNAATNEQLTVRNAHFKEPKRGRILHYVEIMRHPMCAEAKMREWIEKRAYYEKKYNKNNEDDDEKQVISINNWIGIGPITKEAEHGNAAGPSSSSAKKTSCVIS